MSETSIVSVHTIQVSRIDLDPYGIAHHSRYFHWMEEAALNHISALPQALSDVEVDFHRPRMISATGKFINSACLGDTLSVSTRLDAITSVGACWLLTFRHSIKRSQSAFQYFHGKLSLEFQRRST